MDNFGVGESSVGVFATTASGGRAFNGRRFHKGKGRKGALDRFAEELANDPSGNVRTAAIRAGCKAQQGNAMLQRIRKRLGWQAR